MSDRGTLKGVLPRTGLPPLGTIRLGLRKPGGGAMATEYFVLRDAPDVADALGTNTPTEIEVALLGNGITENVVSFFQVFAGGVAGKRGFLICQGDGGEMETLYPHTIKEKDGKTVVGNGAGDQRAANGIAQVDFRLVSGGETIQFHPGDRVTCPGKSNMGRYLHCAACSMRTYLHVYPVCVAKPGKQEIGVYKISTGSWYSWSQILATLEVVHAKAGRVSGIHYIMRIVQRDRPYPGEDKKRHMTTKPAFELIPLGMDFDRLLQLERDAVLRALPAPDDDDTFDADLVVEDEEIPGDGDAEGVKTTPTPTPLASQRPYLPTTILQQMRQQSGDWVQGVLADWSDARKGNTEQRIPPPPEELQAVFDFLGDDMVVVAGYLFDTTPDGMSAGEVGALLILIEQEELARAEVAQIVALAAAELSAQSEAGREPGEG